MGQVWADDLYMPPAHKQMGLSFLPGEGTEGQGKYPLCMAVIPSEQLLCETSQPTFFPLHQMDHQGSL
jgi:hypothetical protein